LLFTIILTMPVQHFCLNPCSHLLISKRILFLLNLNGTAKSFQTQLAIEFSSIFDPKQI